MNGIKVSIIVPVYNVEKYLEKCLDSIVKQTYENIEIILVDDGSTDKSGTILDQYAEMDNRISVIHKKNEGVSTARNTGIEAARGEYICFADADMEKAMNSIDFSYANDVLKRERIRSLQILKKMIEI